MSTLLNPDASVLASLMESHVKELDLIPEQSNCSRSGRLCFHQGLRGAGSGGQQQRFIKIVHCYLLEAGKEKQAEEYLQKVSPASRVQHLESIKMWNYLTLPFQVFKVMEDVGLGVNPSSFFMPPAPPEVFPTPAPGWRPGQAMADGI
ncbi:uncharacterized protein Pyn_02659 [Prunus yedoensis var. nudiflora]|uniref:Uncharacterized protein n=1 Tax=Prunus yedoensis var. nudiflora TaxID=2094558 RepID=A0A314Z7S3_PRUYE|nr:uncharacterized protein Pyn_02659 [Prunus yedoensis var. nudiflora]